MKKLVVLGAGESGVGTAVLGKRQGYEVFVSDAGQLKEKYKNVLTHHEIEWEEGQHTESRILNADLVMKSPGIPDKVPIVRALLKKGVPVISEIEFAGLYTNATLVGITGSNGKTTIKEWLSTILSKKESVAKNPKSYNSQIGVPLSVWGLDNHHTLGIFEATGEVIIINL